MTFKIFVLIPLNANSNVKVSLFQRMNNVTLLRKRETKYKSYCLLYLLVKSTSLLHPTMLKTGRFTWFIPQARIQNRTCEDFKITPVEKVSVCKYLVREKSGSPTK